MKETNMEHYREEIEALDYDIALSNGKVVKCTGSGCYGCDYQDEECSTKLIKWLMAEYKEPVTLTAKEKHLVECLQEGFVARDQNDVVHWFSEKPRKVNYMWTYDKGGKSSTIYPVNALGFNPFPFITYEDKEPWSVEELRKLKVQE